jgi:hypothetical protein
MNCRRGIFTLLFIFCFFLPITGSAQTEIKSYLASPNLDDFPTVHAYLSIYDGEGNFLNGLQASETTMFEDQEIIPAESVQELKPGAQIAIVVNPGQTFALRNSQAVTRYEILLESLNSWLTSRQGSTVDDWSLIAHDGTQIRHVKDPHLLVNALQNNTLENSDLEPSLDNAFLAVELAADPPLRLGMGKSVLLITSPLNEEDQQSLENLSARANELGVRISVWMIGSTSGENRLEAEALINLAGSTGGKFFSFSGEELFPSLEEYYEPLRYVYQITYSSKIRTSGIHQLAAEVQNPLMQTITQPVLFEYNILPPNPVFIKPPIEIKRKPPEMVPGMPENVSLDQYIPRKYYLQILVDYPDGWIRPLKRTSLFVDGVLAGENRQAPFDAFTWDLSSYGMDGNHAIRVEAEDDLGIVGSSIESIVLISHKIPKSQPLAVVYRNLPAFALLVILIAGAILFLVLILGGKIRPFQPGRSRPKQRKNDPVNQPVSIQPEPPPSRPGWINRIPFPLKSPVNRTYAYLTPLEEVRPEIIGRIAEDEGQKKSRRPVHSPPIPISTDEITIGSDPALASLLLTDPSVEGLHARLKHLPDGSFHLIDEGSVAGTWVNFTPIPSEGVILNHGDQINFGRSSFRFKLRRPKKAQKSTVETDQVTDKQNRSQQPDSGTDQDGDASLSN